MALHAGCLLKMEGYLYATIERGCATMRTGSSPITGGNNCRSEAAATAARSSVDRGCALTVFDCPMHSTMISRPRRQGHCRAPNGRATFTHSYRDSSGNTAASTITLSSRCWRPSTAAREKITAKRSSQTPQSCDHTQAGVLRRSVRSGARLRNTVRPPSLSRSTRQAQLVTNVCPATAHRRPPAALGSG